jgi:hypothetical protein
MFTETIADFPKRNRNLGRDARSQARIAADGLSELAIGRFSLSRPDI